MKILKIFLLIVVFLIGCSEGKNGKEKYQENSQGLNKNEKIFTWDDFGKTDTLNLELTSKLNLGFCGRMYINDSLLFFISAYNKEYMITVTDLKGNIINESIRKGRGPNEISQINYLGFFQDKKIMYAYNGDMYNTMYYFNIDDILTKKSPKAVKKFDLGSGIKNIENLLSQNEFLMFSFKSNYKIQIMDSNKTELKKIGKYNIENMNSNNLSYINSAFSRAIIINSKKDKIALFYLNTDVFEIFDTTGNQLFAGHGPDNFNIYNFTPNKIKDPLKFYRGKIGKSRIAYISPKSTSKYIYCLYYGEKIEGEFTSANKILVFDWNGNPIKYLYLSKPISAFDVDEKTNTLYAYNTDTEKLYKAKLNF